MIYFKFDTNGRKEYRHNFPFHEKDGLGKTREQLEQEGILVEQLPPKLPKVEGKTQELYYIDGQLVWQYEDIPLAPEEMKNEKIQELELKVAENTAETLELVATLIEMQKVEQAQSNAEMIELIMSLQGGVE